MSLVPMSPFGTPLMGDTLFGQLCWALRRRHGEARLTELLAGYLEGRPFAVISDAFPAGYVPRPAVPLRWFGDIDPSTRKEIKKRRWLPVTALADPGGWLEASVAVTDAQPHPQPHNTIDRATGTTGRVGFAPYGMIQHWYPPGFAMDCYVLHDPKRITGDEMARLFEDIGVSGFGRDASIGLGRFTATTVATQLPAIPGGATAWLTLAASAPQGLG
ncbi:MAG: CRISPR-associated protein Csm7, partial [Gammaproteobacteria bacterium]